MKPSEEFGSSGDAKKIMDSATRQIAGQTVTGAQLDKARATIANATEDHRAEAAAFTEKTIAWLNDEWNAREFTAEQRIFSVALATINLRQHFPGDRGGKEYFDRVANAAWDYFNTNK